MRIRIAFGALFTLLVLAGCSGESRRQGPTPARSVVRATCSVRRRSPRPRRGAPTGQPAMRSDSKIETTTLIDTRGPDPHRRPQGHGQARRRRAAGRPRRGHRPRLGRGGLLRRPWQRLGAVDAEGAAGRAVRSPREARRSGRRAGAARRAPQDVTGKVADVDSRVDSARESILRLRTLYADATKVSDVIAIEQELATRQAELESLEAQQRALSTQTSQATVRLSLTAAKVAATPPAQAGAPTRRRRRLRERLGRVHRGSGSGDPRAGGGPAVPHPRSAGGVRRPRGVAAAPTLPPTRRDRPRPVLTADFSPLVRGSPLEPRAGGKVGPPHARTPLFPAHLRVSPSKPRAGGESRALSAQGGGSSQEAVVLLGRPDRHARALAGEPAHDHAAVLAARRPVGGRVAEREPDEVRLRSAGSRSPCASSSSRTRTRSPTTTATRSISSAVASGSRHASAAACATDVTANGTCVCRSARRQRRVGRDRVPDPQPGQPVRLRERPQHDQVRVLVEQRQPVRDAGIGDVLAVRLVQRDDDVVRHGAQERDERVAGDHRAGRVVRVADEDQPGLAGDVLEPSRRGRARDRAAGPGSTTRR